MPIRLVTVLMIVLFAAPASAGPLSAFVHAMRTRLRIRTDRSWMQSRRNPQRAGSPRSYFQHCKRLGEQTWMMRAVKSKAGATRKLAQARKVVAVRTDQSSSLQRYLAHVGDSTVEVIYNPHSSANGHMYLRVGEKIYDLGGTRSARVGSFSSLVSRRTGMVGVVYRVPKKRVAELQTLLQGQVDSISRHNLPLFDGSASAATLVPAGTGRYKVKTKATRAYRANGPVEATVATVAGKKLLRSPNGVSIPVISEGKNGSVRVDTTSCTSFVINALSETVPELGTGTLGKYATNYARSAIVKLVRGNAPKTPDLVTIYANSSSVDIRNVVQNVGKKGQ